MTYKDLKKLRRMDLLELLIEQKKDNESLRAEISELKQQLEHAESSAENRAITVDSCGTMAEAALVLNGVFESIDAAASQYLENIKRCSMEQEEAFNVITADARKEAAEIISKAQAEAKEIRAAAEGRLLAASQTAQKTEAEALEKANLIINAAARKAREVLVAAGRT